MTIKARIFNRERIVFLINGVGKTDKHMQNKNGGALSYTTHKNSLEIDERHKHKAWNHTTPVRKCRENSLTLVLATFCSDTTPKHTWQKQRLTSGTTSN